MIITLSLKNKARMGLPYYCYGSRPLLCATHLTKIFPKAAPQLNLHVSLKSQNCSDEQEIHVNREANSKEWKWRGCVSQKWNTLAPAAHIFLTRLITADPKQPVKQSIYLKIENL